MNEVYDYLKKCGTYYLATIDGDQARVRPFGTVCIFKDKLYIQTGKSKDVAKQIANAPKVEICACDGPTWIRVAGTLVEDERIEAQEAMLNDYPSLKRTYQPGDGNTVVYYFKDASASISSFNEETKIYQF